MYKSYFELCVIFMVDCVFSSLSEFVINFCMVLFWRFSHARSWRCWAQTRCLTRGGRRTCCGRRPAPPRSPGANSFASFGEWFVLHLRQNNKICPWKTRSDCSSDKITRHASLRVFHWTNLTTHQLHIVFITVWPVSRGISRPHLYDQTVISKPCHWLCAIISDLMLLNLIILFSAVLLFYKNKCPCMELDLFVY